MRRVHVRAHGFVQGVSFRWYARQHAQSLALSGWVRNCPDGTVEAVAEGQDDAVARFVDWMRHGPSMAQVERLDVEEEAPAGESGSFTIRG
jgi:acylphosphatase